MQKWQPWQQVQTAVTLFYFKLTAQKATDVITAPVSTYISYGTSQFWRVSSWVASSRSRITST